jgi:hypothetical protein
MRDSRGLLPEQPCYDTETVGVFPEQSGQVDDITAFGVRSPAFSMTKPSVVRINDETPTVPFVVQWASAPVKCAFLPQLEPERFEKSRQRYRLTHGFEIE